MAAVAAHSTLIYAVNISDIGFVSSSGKICHCCWLTNLATRFQLVNLSTASLPNLR
jgi:hypothetical protein